MSVLLFAHEKLSIAVYTLATGPGRIKERLEDAAVHSLSYVPLEALAEVDEMAQPLFQKLWERLTRDEAQHSREGKIVSTVRNMTEDEAVELARWICEVEARVTSSLMDE